MAWSWFLKKTVTKKTVFVLLTLSFYSFSVSAATSDSLLQAARSELNAGNPTAAMQFAALARQQSEQGLHNDTLAQSCYWLGNAFTVLGNSVSAEKNYVHAIELAALIGDQSLLSKVYSAYGILFFHQDKYAEAEQQITKALSLARELNDTLALRSCYEYLGSVNMMLSNYSEALAHYLKALKLAETLADKTFEASALQNIGHTYYYLQDFEQAFSYTSKARTLCRELDQDYYVAKCQRILSFIEAARGDVNQSRESFKTYLNLKNEDGEAADPDAVHYTLEFMSLVDAALVEEHAKQVDQLKIQLYSLYALLVVFIGFAGAFYWRSKWPDKAERAKNESAVEVQETHAQKVERIKTTFSVLSGRKNDRLKKSYGLHFLEYSQDEIGEIYAVDRSAISRDLSTCRELFNVESLQQHAHRVGLEQLTNDELAQIFGISHELIAKKRV